MKTAIICTMWLNGEYIPKTYKFLDYYLSEDVQRELGNPDIWLVDNASDVKELAALINKYQDVDNLYVQRYTKHYTRTAHLEYPYCWRALYFARDLFQEYDYDKVIFLNNDSFILSSEMMADIRNLNGYFSPWCWKHNFKECEIQVIHKDCAHYWNITNKPYINYNGIQMEDVIPSKVIKGWTGDRHSEYGMTEIPEDADFSTQVKLGMEVKYRG